MHSQTTNPRRRARTIALEDRAEPICSRTYTGFGQPGPRRSTLIVACAVIGVLGWSVGYRAGTGAAPGSQPVAQSVVEAAGFVARPAQAEQPAAGAVAPPPVAESEPAVEVPADATLFVQAGAFREAENAYTLKFELEAQGISNAAVIPNLEGVPVYRVQVGPLTDANEQAEVVAQLSAAGLTGLMLIDSAAPEVVQRAETAPPPVAEPEPAADIPAESTLFVQAGAFREAENAYTLKFELEAQGIKNAAVIPNLEGVPVYRVQVGPLTDANEQAEVVAQLSAAGLTGLMLIDWAQPDAMQVAAAAPQVAQATQAASVSEATEVTIPDRREIRTDVAATAGPSVAITRSGGTYSPALRQLLRDGVTALNRGDFATAEYKFTQVLAAEPAATKARKYLFTALKEQGRIAEAENVLVTGLQFGSDPAPLAKLYARSLLDRGRSNDALQVLEMHRPAFDADPEYAALLAAVLQRAARHQEAAQIYEQLLTLDRRAGDWWVGLGIAHDGLGRSGDALYAFQQARGTSRISAALADYTDQRIAELQSHD